MMKWFSKKQKNEWPFRIRQHENFSIVEVTDHETGDAIDAREAYVVVGSDVNYCMRDHAHLTETKQPVPKSFDRCAPSMICFRRLENAEAFQQEHGGELLAADLAFAFEPDAPSQGDNTRRDR